jgi:fructose-bisphosphate aldolase, class I
VFLSGGQSGELASARLKAMNILASSAKSRIPWTLAFSFARAIQQPALEIWQGKEANRVPAQRALCHRARCNSAAIRGESSIAMEMN